MGFQAATLLINMIKVARGDEGVEKLPSQTLVPVEVVIRDSVCPPSKVK
jgi:DNA-binding LacI/PurR family transcriptional regulator